MAGQGGPKSVEILVSNIEKGCYHSRQTQEYLLNPLLNNGGNNGLSLLIGKSMWPKHLIVLALM